MLSVRRVFSIVTPSRLLLSVVSFSTRSFLQARNRTERQPFERLLAEVRPLNYALSLRPDLVDFTFDGKLDAAVQCVGRKLFLKVKARMACCKYKQANKGEMEKSPSR